MVPLTSIELRSDATEFGGLSALELSPTGDQATVVSDTGMIYHFDLLRHEDGSIKHVHLHPGTRLLMEGGINPDEKLLRDTEGLAIGADGTMFLAAESKMRLLTYAPASDTPKASRLPELRPNIPKNVGYEALAVDQRGRLYTLAESSGSLNLPFSLMRREAESEWEEIYALPRAGGFRPVGADFGPDGHLYVLSRAFSGFAFSTRIDRVRFDGDHVIGQDRLFSGRYGQFDNLEGIAIWQPKGKSIRALTISDDNFSSLQRSLLIEFVLKE